MAAATAAAIGNTSGGDPSMRSNLAFLRAKKNRGRQLHGIMGSLDGGLANQQQDDMAMLYEMDQKLDKLIEVGTNTVGENAVTGDTGTAITTGGFDDSTLNAANAIHGTEAERTAAATTSAIAAGISGG